jgi:hypothetical protein
MKEGFDNNTERHLGFTNGSIHEHVGVFNYLHPGLLTPVGNFCLKTEAGQPEAINADSLKGLSAKSLEPCRRIFDLQSKNDADAHVTPVTDLLTAPAPAGIDSAAKGVPRSDRYIGLVEFTK